MFLRAVVVVVVALTTPAEVLAAPIAFTFTGNVTFVDPALAGTFNTTQTLSGFHIFESLAPDLDPRPHQGGVCDTRA
jgi:hypothetical protein